VVVTTRPDAAPQGPDDPAALLISEILKQQKQLIINGRDYIETLSDQRNVREADDRLNGDFARPKLDPNSQGCDRNKADMKGRDPLPTP